MAERYYDSPMTGAQLDAAFAGMADIENSVAQAAASAGTAQRYGQIVEQNAQAIGQIGENLSVIQAAPAKAQAAADSADAAARSEQSAASSAASARDAAEQAQQVAQGAQGWYETDAALKAAHPTGQNGQWAIIGETDTIWTWDSDTNAWKNTSVKTDLSNYYTKSQTDSMYLTKASVLNLIYPVGSVYLSTSNVSPQTFLGGSWAKIEGRFLLAADSAHPAGSTGGEETQTISLQQIPDHYHIISTGDGSGAGYNYPGYAAIVTQNAGESPSNAYACNTGYVAGRNNVDQQPLSTMPPYLAVYMWKRTG